MAQSIREFVETRRPRWERLEAIIRLLESGHHKDLSAAQLADVDRLYREAAADLARLQTFREGTDVPDELETYLNQLVARAYGQVYRSPPPSWTSLWQFLGSRFPETFRETAPYTLVAFGLFVLGAVFGLVASLTESAFIPLIVTPGIIEKVEGGKVWFDSILAVRPLASSMIMTNNISVSFLAFALGMTFGLGTLYLMVFNGVMLGTLAALCHMHGLDVPFWSFVLPHGVIELTSIFIAGGGGFVLGTALLVPGDLPRKEALIEQGRRAGRLITGCVPLLVLAAIVEAFFSPSHIPAFIKFAVAGLLFVFLLAYLLLPRRVASGSQSGKAFPGRG